MILKAAERPASGIDEADFVIVGSGAAGATQALMLAELGCSVIVLEEGPLVAVKERTRDVFTTMRRTIRGGFGAAMLGRATSPIVQGSAVGGSTLVNSAIIWRLPEDVIAEWDRIPGLQGALPHAELMANFDRIEKDLEIGEIPLDRMGENGRRMMEGAEKLGFSGNIIRRNVKGCQGSGRCLQGCPHGAKLSMDLTYLPRAAALGARIHPDCKVERITFQGAKASGVEARFVNPLTRVPEGRFTVKARRGVIVAASAIQSPNLLRRSGVQKAVPQVGNFFTCHPGTAVAGEFDTPVHMWYGATQAWESIHYRPEGFKLESINLPPELAVVRVPGSGKELMQRLGGFANTALWAFQVRTRARGTVRPTPLIGGDLVRFDTDARDMALAARAIKILGEMMFATGARKVSLGVHGMPEEITSPDQLKPLEGATLHPKQLHMMASHLFGTCALSASRDLGVVDRNFQVHGVPGLFVVDSSVFPTNLGVNPQHSIMAVSMLAAGRIARGTGAVQG